MTDTELKYYSNLKMQEKFREAMGEWKVGDKGLFKGGMVGHYQGFWTDESCAIHSFMFGVESLDTRSEEPIRIPLPIDPENPERGLFGMLEKEEFRGLYPSTCEHQAEWTCRVYKEGTSIFYDSATPTLALLKALAEQWEIIAEEA